MLVNQKHFLPSKYTFSLKFQIDLNSFAPDRLLPPAFTQFLSIVCKQDLVLVGT